MFPNDGPVAAHNAVRNYVARVGLSAFPEDYREAFESLLSMPLFEALTSGVERMYAAVRQLADLPDRDGALLALGEAAQASAIAALEGQAERRWAIQAWTLAEITEPGVENPLAPAPDVEARFAFFQTAADLPGPAPEADPA
ncbi:MAG: hypothetical protein JHC81_04920 [Brevundimonas sp.]|uniref:hypothetical protein n=1 Tax=Brevundimonas sp. TaxID=1871086 RepID=UPI001A2D42CE|nr:hypothetical protein [Brevundimonas sp.]MBJ7446857.1 hypothetical protein [Brevundimonas sp.]